MVPPNLNALLYARQTDPNCIPCNDPSPCNCASNEQCITVNRDCNTCSFNKCVPLSSSKAGGVSAGAVAGAVIASIIFLIAGVLAFLWYRRRQRALAAASSGGELKRETPARAEDVLNRPDPNEKPPTPAPEENFRAYVGDSATTINFDPRSQGSSAVGTPGHSAMRTSVQSNPFEDNHSVQDNQSIQTSSTGTRSNVIPIALVGPASTRSDPSQVASTTNATAGTAPMRPARDPSLNINLDNRAQPDPSRTPTSYEQSTVSGFTGYNRNSYMTTGSYASDLLSEAPVIITPTHGTIKQVLGTAKAEVIRNGPSSASAPASADSRQATFLNVAANRQTARSPLAATSFVPADLSHQSQDIQVDQGPFGDEHSPYLVNGSAHNSPAPSQRSFAIPEETPSPYTGEPVWSPEQPRRPWEKARPDSVSTQAQSIIGAEFTSATRVNVGLNHLSTESYETQDTPVSAALSTPRTPYRMTSAKLVSPTNGNQPAHSPISPAHGGAFEMQQRRALEGLDAAQRMSRASVLSSTSTKADSILEGFPFVPPSPISDRPARTPPRSPLAQQSFSNGNGAGSQPPSPSPNLSIPTVSIQPLSVQKDQKREVQQEANAASDSEDGQTAVARPRPPKKQQSKFPPPVMNRKVLGLSTASQSSTASNGLGSFPFQIDTGVTTDSASSTTPSSYASSGRQRASLDTLALTSDLSSYPLGFDKNIMEHYPGAKR
ncbi:hypothetical protein QCA50_000811 [Cerrena zonata]|uniref:Membrane anchor Opy2 N-terminal domain-containing protein n=1 Tax=Cerrena zonata TaxID=2478898 RepID=A0AAW0H057_9APHY